MIRKISTGEYRLYSRKLNPKTKRRRNLGTFKNTRCRATARTRSSVLQKTLCAAMRRSSSSAWHID